MLASYAACTTDVCALQRQIIILTYHKGLWRFLGIMLYKHLLAHIQMLEMTLFKPPFVDAVFPFMLFAYQPWPSLIVLLSVTLSFPHCSYFKALFTSSATSWQRYLHCPFQAGSYLSPKQLFAFTEIQVLLHCRNHLKNASLLKAILFYAISAIPYTSSSTAANSKHCPTTSIYVFN